jgi:hypothetical protein
LFIAALYAALKRRSSTVINAALPQYYKHAGTTEVVPFPV